MTEEAAVETLPSIPEMVPGVVALAEQQQHMVRLQAIHTHGRGHLQLPQVALD